MHVQIYKIPIISLDVWQNHIKKYDFCFRSNEVRAFESISSFYSISEIMNPDAWVWWGFWIDFVIEFSLRSDHIWTLKPDEAFESISLSDPLGEMINSSAWAQWGSCIDFLIRVSLKNDQFLGLSLGAPVRIWWFGSSWEFQSSQTLRI